MKSVALFFMIHLQLNFEWTLDGMKEGDYLRFWMFDENDLKLDQIKQKIYNLKVAQDLPLEIEESFLQNKPILLLKLSAKFAPIFWQELQTLQVRDCRGTMSKLLEVLTAEPLSVQGANNMPTSNNNNNQNDTLAMGSEFNNEAPLVSSNPADAIDVDLSQGFSDMGLNQ